MSIKSTINKKLFENYEKRDYSQYLQPVPQASSASGSVTAPSQSGKFNPGKDNNIQIIIDEAKRQGITDKNQIAYILATAQHESASFNTLTEYASGEAYEGRQDLGNTQAGDGVKYKGRGFAQLTGRNNYQKYSDILGKDLIGNPDQLSEDPHTAAFILVHGMKTGHFTGVGLDKYIGNGKADYRNARRIVNGTDKADHIANIAREYEKQI